MCFMMLTCFVNVHVHVNTGTKGNLVTAERDQNILQFESPLSTSERPPKLIEGSKYVYCTCLKCSLNRPDVFRDRNHRINYCEFSLSRDEETNPGPPVVDPPPSKTIVAPYS